MPKVLAHGQQLMNFISAITSRAKLAGLAGLQYNGERDLYTALGYTKQLTYDHYSNRYQRGGIAKRIIDAFPRATWRNTPIVTEAGKHPDDSEFAKNFQTLAKNTNLFHYLERVDRLSGIGHYGVLLVGLRASGPLKDPVRLKRSRTIDDVLFLAPYTEGSASIQSYNLVPSSDKFGLPQFYEIDLRGNIVGDVSSLPGVASQETVHASRVLHVAEELNEDELFGTPRLHPIWNYLMDLDKVIGSTAEAIWRTVDRGIQFDVDKEAQLGDGELDDFADEIEEFMHGFKRYIRTRGITAKVLGSDVPNPEGACGQLIGLISGTTGIPQRILMGSERGQLASGQDEKNFNSRVRERQTSFAQPRILEPFINMMISHGVLPEVEYEIQWPDLSTLTEKERADVGARYGQAAKSFSEAIGPFLGKEEVRERFFRLPRELPKELVDAIEDAEEVSTDEAASTSQEEVADSSNKKENSSDE